MPQFPAPSRRDFLRSAAAGLGGLAAAGLTARSTERVLGKAKNCIFINLVGGPSHLDTFDPKPNAPSEFRGPFLPIQTKVPGLHLSELLPKLAGMADKFSLVRSMHSAAPPIHECGFQLINTGRLFRDGPEWPHVGAVASYLKAKACEKAFYLGIPTLELNTGVDVSRGFGTAYLDVEPRIVRDRNYASNRCEFDRTEFGRNCTLAAVSTEDSASGAAHFAVVNMFSTVFDSPSWDCHADGGSLRTDLNDIRNIVAPSFDCGFAQLIQGLEQSGRLESTLVVAAGEFGRSPRLNSNGGRDHWSGAWTVLLAGGGIAGGRTIGCTDSKGTEPIERPVSPQDLVSTILFALGIPHDATIPAPDGSTVQAYPGKPVLELF